MFIEHNNSINDKSKFFTESLLMFVMVLISLVLIFSYGVGDVTAQGPFQSSIAPSNNLSTSTVGVTDSKKAFQYTSKTNISKSTANTSNLEKIQTLPDPQIYRNGVPVGPVYGTISEAIAASQSGDTIMLEDGATFNEHGLNIYKDLDFNVFNNGYAIIDGQSIDTVFIIHSGVKVNLQNLIITNGQTPTGYGFGGAIWNTGTLNVKDCTFTLNNANYGAGIYNDGILTVSDCSFTNNIATNDGGAIWNSEIGSMTVNHCSFTSNSADPDYGVGGAITSYGTSIMTETIFNGNHAGYAGAIANDEGIMNLNKCSFTNNYADQSMGVAGAIWNGNFNENIGTLTVTDSTFTSNSAGQGYGGAIENDDTLRISGCTFINNTAGDGGAIYNYGGTVNVANSHFADNIADASARGANSVGGALYSGNSYDIDTGALISEGTATVTNCTFTRNHAYGGGAIVNLGTLMMVSDSNFTNNTAIGSGGAIASGTDLIINNSDFTGNTATFGGAVDNYGNLTVNNSNFTDNMATSDAGAISSWSWIDVFPISTLTVNNCNFTRNTAMFGGAIENLTGYCDINNSNFTDNTADATEGYGGAIENYGTLNVTSCNFTGNSAGVAGGAIDNYAGEVNGTIYVGIINAHFNRFEDNSAPEGSAINNENGMIDATLNWWGSNNNPSENVFDATVTPWMVLTVTANPTTILSGHTSTVTADLLHDSGILTDPTNPNLYYHNPSMGHLPDGISVNFTGDALGNVFPLTKTISNGTATTTFTGNAAGVSHPESFVDSSNHIPTTVNIEWIQTEMVVNPVNGFKGELVDLTATLTDTFNNIPLAGKSIQFSINGNIVGTAVTNAQGIATLTYTITQNTGTYRILGEFLQDTIYTGTSNTNTLKVSARTPPVVIGTDPLKNAVNVAIYKIIKVTFNEPIKFGDDSWIQLKLTNSPGTDYAFKQTILNNVLTITPNSILLYGTKYTVILHTDSILSLTGTGITEPYMISFTVDTPPVVINTNPVNNGFNIPLNHVIKVNFDKAIKYGNGWIEIINSNGAIKPYTTSITGKTLNIIPKSILSYGDVYTVIIHTNSVLSLGRAGITAPYTFRFTADKPPVVTSTNPLNNAFKVSLNKMILYRFNKAIKYGNGWIELINSKGISKSFKTSITGNTMYIKPTTPFTKGTSYTVFVHTNAVKSLGGAGLTSPNTTRFTTA